MTKTQTKQNAQIAAAMATTTGAAPAPAPKGKGKASDADLKGPRVWTLGVFREGSFERILSSEDHNGLEKLGAGYNKAMKTRVAFVVDSEHVGVAGRVVENPEDEEIEDEDEEEEGAA